MAASTPGDLPLVLAAMAALDATVAAHRAVLDRLQAAFDEGVRLDEELRRTSHGDEAGVLPLAQSLAFAVALTQSLSFREARARAEVGRAQAALAEARRQDLMVRFAEVQLALADDTTALARTLREHEEELRRLLQRSGQLHGEAAFLAGALAHDPGARALLTPGWEKARTTAACGPAFLRALADCMEGQILEGQLALPPEPGRALLPPHPLGDPLDQLLGAPQPSALLGRVDLVQATARPASGGKR